MKTQFFPIHAIRNTVRSRMTELGREILKIKDEKTTLNYYSFLSKIKQGNKSFYEVRNVFSTLDSSGKGQISEMRLDFSLKEFEVAKDAHFGVAGFSVCEDSVALKFDDKEYEQEEYSKIMREWTGADMSKIDTKESLI